MSSTAALPAVALRKITVRDAAVLLAIAWLVPFLVHLVPWSGARPLGVYLLPMFWTTLVAAYFYGAIMGLLTAVLIPAINLLVTGLPAWRIFGLMSLELAVFALAFAGAVRLAPRFWLWAPLAYCAGRAASILLQVVTGTFHPANGPLAYVTHSLFNALAGLAVLTAINFALVRFYPKAPASSAA